jgi:HSP20 family protein
MAITENALDEVAQWFSPDVAFPFGRLGHRPTVTNRPRVDVAEKDGMLIITAEIPGVKRDDLHVHLDCGALVIQGETRGDPALNDADYVSIERNLGSYYRRLPLPFEPDATAITADFRDGVLELRIPRPVTDAVPGRDDRNRLAR